MKKPELVSISASARKLGVSRATIYSWIDRGCPRHGDKLDPVEVSNWRLAGGHSAPTAAKSYGGMVTPQELAIFDAETIEIQSELAEIFNPQPQEKTHD